MYFAFYVLCTLSSMYFVLCTFVLQRGWTTWTTGAVVPDRVIAMVPIVEDALNLQAVSLRNNVV